jgi:hypothetical protein
VQALCRLCAASSRPIFVTLYSARRSEETIQPAFLCSFPVVTVSRWVESESLYGQEILGGRDSKKQQDAGVSWEKARNGQERVWGASRGEDASVEFFVQDSRTELRVDAGMADAAKDLIRLLRGPDPFCELNLLARFKKGALA